ncbi:FecR family protein [Caulobacter endophyticus]|uniref:FecR family protein n=1 Tax=Caulobacter endophyticus TaxID=2172652 RepID=UPI00240F566C|nr:FecR domain-containing protein [Caulobacter endophyticus]MDG2529405.1 FecR domain-containing protein [Caulobacter endophyticus]
MSAYPLDAEDMARLPREEAAALLWLNVDESDPDQAAVLDAWLDREPGNREAWLRAQAIWSGFDEVGDEATMRTLRRRARKAAVRLPSPRWMAAAAVFVVAVGLGLWLAERPVPPSPPPVPQAIAMFGEPDLVATGATQTFDLPDGSKASLAPGSALDLAYDHGGRAIRLVRGRAFFDVAPDRERPFTVEAGGRRITALGTRFDVRLDQGPLRVTLVEGQVSVARTPDALDGPGRPVVLAPGRQLTAAHGRDIVAPADEAEAAAWRETSITFEDRPLSEVTAELNRHSAGKLVVEDPEVAAMRLTGRFRTGDPRRFLRTVSQVLPVRGEAAGPGRYRIVRAD